MFPTKNQIISIACHWIIRKDWFRKLEFDTNQSNSRHQRTTPSQVSSHWHQYSAELHQSILCKNNDHHIECEGIQENLTFECHHDN
jgi:hypothetical protein